MIRFGVIGTNWITESFLDAGRQCADFALTAVYSRTSERAKAFAEQQGADRWFTDVEEMAASGAIDAVYIASPTSLHADQAIACMRNGVHVLCEKPMASNAAEVRRMIEVAREHGVTLMEAMKSTLLPNFQAVVEHIGRLGQVRRYFASYCQYSSRYDAYRQGTVLNAFNPAFSNGALMDLGTYCIYPAIVLFGKPLSVRASGLLLDSGVDGEGSLLLQYPDMEAVVMYSKISDSALPNEIQGEDGTMRIDRISQPAAVQLQIRKGELETLSREQAANTMVYEAEEFIRLVQRGERESSVNTLERSLWTMEVMDEARQQIGLVFPADAER